MTTRDVDDYSAEKPDIERNLRALLFEREAEIERLRMALQEIADYGPTTAMQLRDIARSASGAKAMTDITEQLHALYATHPIVMEAADEIDLLRDAYHILKRDYDALRSERDASVHMDIARMQEIERLRALVEDALRGLHNDFEPDNQSALYNRIRCALEPEL